MKTDKCQKLELRVFLPQSDKGIELGKGRYTQGVGMSQGQLQAPRGVGHEFLTRLLFLEGRLLRTHWRSGQTPCKWPQWTVKQWPLPEAGNQGKPCGDVPVTVSATLVLSPTGLLTHSLQSPWG